MPSKKELPNSEARDRDIQLLFSRAGLSGARYQVFPRREAASVPAVLPADSHASWKPVPVTEPKIRAAANVPAPPVPALVTKGQIEEAATSWSSLERIFAGNTAEETLPGPIDSGVRVALLSLAGGVGKTTLAVTLGRILSGQQRQVLIGDCGFLPAVTHHFGSRGQRLGPMHFFYPPPGSHALPVGTFRFSPSEKHKEDFQNILMQVEASESLLLLDLPTLQSSTPGELLDCATHVLAPITPEVHSIAGLVQLQQVLADQSRSDRPLRVHYLINRFDESRPLHHEVRARLQQQLGKSLLPFVVHEDPAIAEAAANGMTIVEYRPQSAAAEDMMMVAGWLGRVADEAAGMDQELSR